MWLKHVKAILTQLYYVTLIFQMYPKFCPYSPRESLFTPRYGIVEYMTEWLSLSDAVTNAAWIRELLTGMDRAELVYDGLLT